jgi:uncharacterized membrane protein YozB (DUF420 family)
MATTVARPVLRRTDDTFFISMSVVILATVVFGFAHTYFLAGVFMAPLPSFLVHVHGAIFSSWIILFIVQTALVANRRIRLHRTLGTAGACLAALMVVVGIAATIAMVRRGATPPIFTPPMFLVLNCWGVTLFGLMIGWAILLRRDGAAHKRIMLLATIGIMPPAITRWPVAILHQKPFLIGVVFLCFCLAVVVFDLWTRHRPHYATVVCSLLVLSVQPTATALGHTPQLQHIAAWLIQHP